MSKQWGGSQPELHEVNGRAITIKQAAVMYEIPVSRLRSRIKYGNSLQEAVDLGPEWQFPKIRGNAAWLALGG